MKIKDLERQVIAYLRKVPFTYLLSEYTFKN